ncbi:MAG: NnrS family protein [Conexivisphaerales archaeon]
MNRARLQLAASLVFMILALILGIFRLMNIHSIDAYPSFLAVLYPLHPNIMVFGFLVPIIMTERMVGSKILNLSRIYNLSADLMVPLTIFGLVLQIVSFLTDIRLLNTLGGVLIVFALLLFILLLYALSIKTDTKLPFYFMILSILPILGFAILWIDSMYILGIAEVLLLLLFPIIFIFGERVELTRFVSKKYSLSAYRSVFILCGFATALTLVSAIYTTGHLALYLVFSVLMFISVVLIYSEQRNFIRASKSALPLQRYVGRHVTVAYLWLIAGCVFGLMYASGFPGFMYDALIHSFTVGYIGTMLLAHGPVILPSVTGRKVDQSKVTLLPLILLTLSNLIRVFGDISLSQSIQNIISFASGVSGWFILVAIVIFLRSLLFSARA